MAEDLALVHILLLFLSVLNIHAADAHGDRASLNRLTVRQPTC